MGFPTRGGVMLGAVTFNTDPNPYEHQMWPKRQSIHKTIGGGQVIQDFGSFQTDNVLTLESGQGQFLDEVKRADINTMRFTTAATWAFKDYLGNEFTVYIQAFVPTIFKMGLGSGGVPTQLYHYKMTLQVVSIQKLYGVVYSGA